MRNGIKIIPALFVSVFLAMHLSCSPISPTAGTETGNPGVVTSASLVFSLLTDSRWNPESHLEGGVGQLDPEYAIGPQPAVHLAKRKATREDPNTGVEINIITYHDTIITIDTLLVNDTVVQTYSKQDTITMGSSEIVLDSLIVDSIYVTDTILQYDTTVTRHNDTVWVPVKSDTSPSNPVIITKGRLSYVTQSYRNVNEHSFPISGGTESVYAIDGRWGRILLTLDDYNSSNTKNLQSISRYDSSNGIRSMEQYEDGNGDNLLYFSIGNTVPQIKLTGRYWDAVYEKNVEVHFDAGDDNTFSTTDDNRIYSLVKKKIKGGTVLSKITYRETNHDSVLLTVSESASTDSVAKNDILYIGIHGDDPLDHRDNALKEIQQNIRYRKGAIEKIKLTMQFSRPVGEGEITDSVSVSSIIWLVDGRIEVLNGQIKDDILEGTVWKDGLEHDVICKIVDGKIELVPATKKKGDEH